MGYQTTIGLEIHIRLKTDTKLFCSCPIADATTPNTHVCEICLGHPGTLPRINRHAIEQAARTTAALGMQLERQIRFDRKHYFYPDLSKNYQTSQFYAPLGTGGSLEYMLRGKKIHVRFREAHIEEDAASLEHGPYESMVKYDRGGAPLLEVVTEPDLHTGDEARELLRQLRLICRTISTAEGRFEEGELRCDVNVSVAPRGASLGTRVEIKNLNSPRFVAMAIEREAERQIEIIESGGDIVQETRLWNPSRGVTESMRTKEEAHDYRYMTDPDLGVLVLTDQDYDIIVAEMPELPLQRLTRLQRDYNLSHAAASELVATEGMADYFEECAISAPNARMVVDWMMNSMRELFKRTGGSFSDPGVPPHVLAEILSYVDSETISTGSGKKILSLIHNSDHSIPELISQHGLTQVSDRDTIKEWIASVLDTEYKAVQSLAEGNSASLGYLVGKVIQLSQGQVNPRIVRDLLQNQLAVSRLLVVFMGGAITGERNEDGLVVPGGEHPQEKLLGSVRNAEHLRIESSEISRELSENLRPRDWFELWSLLSRTIGKELYSGIVVTHGLDTIVHTASLMRWLLPDLNIPIVFTAAVRPPQDSDTDAISCFNLAIEAAANPELSGVWVCYGSALVPAVNLRLMGLEDGGIKPFHHPGNTAKELSALASGSWESPKVSVNDLDDVLERTLWVRPYPGMSNRWLLKAVRSGVRYLLLELYDTGTGNVLWSGDQSLLPVVREVQARSGAVFCTSQLDIPVDLDTYESSQDLWRAGIVPLGNLVADSAYTKLIAAQLITDDRSLVIHHMTASEFAL